MSNQVADNNNAQKNNNLPNFMNEKSQANYAEIEDNRNSWLANNLHRLMIWVSAAWFGIILIYITQFFGWSNLFLMMPDEFGGFLAGITLPLAIIWVVMAYIDRGTSFKNEAKLLRAYMNQLVYPNADNGAQTAKAMADAIRSQVIELQQVTKMANEQTAKIKDDLGDKVTEFAKLVSALDTYSSRTLVEMTEGVKILVKNFDNVSQKTESSMANFQNYNQELVANANTIKGSLSNLFDSIVPRISELKTAGQALNAIAENSTQSMNKSHDIMQKFNQYANENLDKVSNTIDYQINNLEKVSQNALNSFDSIKVAVSAEMEKLEEALVSKSVNLQNSILNIDKSSDDLLSKFSSHGDLLAQEVDKILVRSSTIEESIAIQVGNLSDVSNTIINNLQEVDNALSDEINNLNDKSNHATDNISNYIDTVIIKSQEILDLSDKSRQQSTDIVADISKQHNELEQISTNIASRLHELSGKMAITSTDLQSQSEEALNKLNEVGSSMQKQTASLAEASSIVVAQTQVSEASLIQQQRNINNSAARVDEIKVELKRQIEALSQSSAMIESDASNMVEKLKKQLDIMLGSCTQVVEQTKTINGNLSAQAIEFDTSTNKTLAKVSQLENILITQSSNMNNLSQDISKRAKDVDVILNKHSNNIESATQSANEVMNNLLTSFEKQNSILNTVSENAIGYITDVVQSLDDKANTINILFKSQESEFFDICDKISDNTINMSDALKKQIKIIEQSADKVFSRMVLLEEDTHKHAEVVVNNTHKSIDRLSEVENMLNSKNELATDLLKRVTANLDSISEQVQKNIKNFDEKVNSLCDGTSLSSKIILENCNKIQGANNNLASETQNVSKMMDAHLKSLDVTMVKTKLQADNIKEIFDEQKDSLGEIINTLSTQSRLGEASLSQHYKYLTDISVEVSKRVEEINEKFQNNANNINDVSNKFVYEFDVLGDRLIKASEDISKVSKNSMKNVEQVNMALSQCSEDLDSTIHHSIENIGGVFKDYEKYISGFNTITAETSSGVIEINNLISEQSNKMVTISEDTKKLVDCFNTVLNDTSMQLSNRANVAYDKVKGLGDDLKNLSVQLEEATRLSATHFENSGSKIRATINEVSTNAERISNDIRSSGEVFIKQSGVLVATTDDILNKVNSAMSSLLESSQSFSERGDNIVKQSIHFNDIVNSQIKILNESTKKADTALKSVVKTYEGIQIDTFLKDAGIIIEKLETCSVDINRVFNPKDEEDLWKKFRAGDSGVFVRYLAKNMTKQQVAAIRNEFDKNNEFRGLVSGYLSEFEHLVSKAKTNERSGILISVISGADIGKLYYILAKSLDKLN